MLGDEPLLASGFFRVCYSGVLQKDLGAPYTVPMSPCPPPGSSTFHVGPGLDVAEVGAHPGRVRDVVEGQAAHQGAVLQEE